LSCYHKVAKELGRKGFGKVFVMAGGFDGRTGWVQNKLSVKPAAVSSLSLAPPARTMSTRPLVRGAASGQRPSSRTSN
jgi:hypothetical protein